jgi:serine/threonine-protein kinase RsbW
VRLGAGARPLRKGAITLSIESEAGNVFLIGLAINRIASSIPVSGQSAFEMELAVVEAVNNAIEHAHHYQRNKAVTVRVRLHSDHIQFTIIDRGAPFDFAAGLAMSSRLDHGEQPERGRGLKIIQELMDEVRYERKGETNQISLTKRLT